MLLGKRGDLLGIERDECDEVRTAVPDHHALRDPAGLLDVVLEVGRRDVLAAGGDDDVLLAPGDVEEAVLVHAPEVAGVEPSVDEGLARRVGVLVVAAEDVVAAKEDLAVLGDLHLNALESLADRSEAVALTRVDDRRGRGLGHAVSLEDRDAAGVEELEDLGRDRCSAGYALPDAPAEQPSDVPVERLLCLVERLAQLGRNLLAALLGLPHPYPDLDGLADRVRIVGVRHRQRVELLEDPRH